MLSDQDKLILSKLQTEYPEAYEMFLRTEKQHRNNVKAGCHDIRNIVTLLSGSYQLLTLTNPQLNSISRFNQMGEDIKSLVKAFNDIAAYRYAASLKPTDVEPEQLITILSNYIKDIYFEKQPLISLTLDTDIHEIHLDLNRISTAIFCLINNAVEAADFSVSDPLPVKIILSVLKKGGFPVLRSTVANIGSGPSPEIISDMYQPFRTDKSGHLGLGLSIAAETAAACGGSLNCTLQEHICRFDFIVPCRPEPEDENPIIRT